MADPFTLTWGQVLAQICEVVPEDISTDLMLRVLGALDTVRALEAKNLSKLTSGTRHDCFGFLFHHSISLRRKHLRHHLDGCATFVNPPLRR
jgi:hypothetical protein